MKNTVSNNSEYLILEEFGLWFILKLTGSVVFMDLTKFLCYLSTVGCLKKSHWSINRIFTIHILIKI